MNRDGTVIADATTLKTNRANVYAGGDVVNGITNVTTAMGSGKKAARAIDEMLMGPGRFERTLGTFSYAMDLPEWPAEVERHVSALRDAQSRAEDFEEVMLGIGREAAREESCRCLRCDVKGECA